MNVDTRTTTTTTKTTTDEPATRPMTMDDTTTAPPIELSDQWKTFIKRRVERMMSGKLPKHISAELAFNGSKSGCQRVQFIDGQLYIYLHKIEKMARWQQCRIYNFLKLVTEAHKQENLPDFEITLCGRDCPHNSVHVFGTVTCDDDKFFFNIPIVQWFDDRDGPLHLVNNRVQSTLQRTLSRPWKNKWPSAVYRGELRRNTWSRDLPNGVDHLGINTTNWWQYGRGKLLFVRHLPGSESLLNVNLQHTEWMQEIASGKMSLKLFPGDKPPAFSMDEQSRLFKYVIYAEGNCGWADRLKWLMMMGMVPIVQSTACGEFYLREFMDEGVNYLATDGLFANLTEVVRWAKDHDGEMEQLVRRNLELARNVLSWQGLVYYTGQLVARWAERLAFRPRLDRSSSSGRAYRFVGDHSYETCAFRPHLYQKAS